MMMWTWLAGAAMAAAPEVSVRSDGAVVGSVAVQADASAVRAVMSNPELIASIDGSTQVSSEKDGDCLLIRYTVPHPILEVSYTARGCPAAGGMIYTLVESDDLKRFSSSWTVTEAGEGRSVLEYSVLTVPAVPIPQRIVSYQATAGVERFLSRIAQHVEASR